MKRVKAKYATRYHHYTLIQQRCTWDAEGFLVLTGTKKVVGRVRFPFLPSIDSSQSNQVLKVAPTADDDPVDMYSCWPPPLDR